MADVDFSAYQEESSEGKKDLLLELKGHVKDLMDKEKQLSNLEEMVASLKDDITDIKRKVIPDILNEANMPSVTVKSDEGSNWIITVGDEVKANIKKGTENIAFNDMVQAELTTDGMSENLAKEIISAKFKNQFVILNPTKEYEEKLIEAGIPFDPSRTIHLKTLQSWVKSAYERGISIPESITAFKYQEAKIKIKEN